MEELARGRCLPCRGGEPRLGGPHTEEFVRAVPDWRVVGHDGIKRLERGFGFADFAPALDFTDRPARGPRRPAATWRSRKSGGG